MIVAIEYEYKQMNSKIINTYKQGIHVIKLDKKLDEDKVKNASKVGEKFEKDKSMQTQ